MPFRFNQKDMAILACSPTTKFNKEGLLWFKEKEGKLFNKTEHFSERLVRLYGNLLFYFKGKDVSSECSGMIVLEKYKVVPDSSVKEFGFNIEFHVEDGHRYEFAAEHKEDYDDWVALLKRSSLEKLSKKLQSLREEIQMYTEEDPYPDYHSSIALDNVKIGCTRMSLFSHHGHGDDVIDSGHLTEICINCSDLRTSREHLPSAMIQVHTVVPPSTEWVKHSQTEICEKSKEPYFLRTIVFASTYPPMTRIKFIVYDILDKTNSQTAIIGYLVCSIHDIHKAPNWEVSYNIANSDGETCGIINIVGWKRRGCSLFTPPMENVKVLEDRGEEIGKAIVDNYTVNQKRRFFNIPTTNGRTLKFQDILAESVLCFKIPKLLLSLFIKEEKDGVVELHNIGNLHPEWDIMKERVQNAHIDHIQQYSTILADFCQFEGLNMKKSVHKTKKELDFIPTNLHLQRLAVTDNDDKEFLYDIVTVGVPAAHSLKFKNGGLKRLLSIVDESARKTLQSDDHEDLRNANLIKALHIKGSLKSYTREISFLLSILKNYEKFSDPVELAEITTKASMKIGELLTLISTSFVKDSEEVLLKARTHGPELRIKSTVISSGIDDTQYKGLNWEWTGSEYKAVKFSTVSYDCQVRDTLGRFMAQVNQTFISNKADDLLLLLDNLDKSVKSLINKMNVLMRFVLMQNQTIDSPMVGIRYRADIVFSQIITTVVSGFALFLSKHISNTRIMEQITKIGLLVQFESLLTTSGDELGMLEDMYAGLTMLKTVTFEITCSETSSLPTLSGTRANLVVTFHIHPNLYITLPKKLREHRIIKLHPVFFSVGINEQATVAERFGDTSFQETINHESLQYLQIYIDELKKLFNVSADSALEKLMSQLHLTINTKKNKNYDILLLAEEVCMESNGLRITMCKSAKDRSSMAVTLEMACILKREHGLREDAFQRVLDSIRSQGTRLINSYKNVGLPKYAFNKVQVKALPSVYRPPEGTIGKYIQT